MLYISYLYVYVYLDVYVCMYVIVKCPLNSLVGININDCKSSLVI